MNIVLLQETMKIEFHNVIPDPMAHLPIPEESVWKKDHVPFDSSNRYQVKAASGKGKSTFVAYTYGLRQDFSGEVLLDGKSTKEIDLMAWAEIRRTRLSIIFQDLRIFPELTVAENLMVKNDLTGHKTEKEIQGMLDTLGVADKWEQRCGNLSFGQRQRVMIVRSLCQPFDSLLMDEPFSHLDDANIKIACELIEEECRKNDAGYVLTTLGEDYYFTYDERLTV